MANQRTLHHAHAQHATICFLVLSRFCHLSACRSCNRDATIDIVVRKVKHSDGSHSKSLRILYADWHAADPVQYSILGVGFMHRGPNMYMHESRCLIRPLVRDPRLRRPMFKTPLSLVLVVATLTLLTTSIPTHLWQGGRG